MPVMDGFHCANERKEINIQRFSSNLRRKSAYIQANSKPKPCKNSYCVTAW